MAKAAAAGGPLLPEDLVVWEILTRLPAKPLLRCRAVCRSWRRRLTTDAKFLLAHHRRQPSLPLLTSWDTDTHDRRIDALDHRTAERHPVARRTPGATAANEDDLNVLPSCDGLVPILRTTGRTAANEDELHVLASCDGLLILLANGGLQICNPATRQRAPLPLLHGANCISALYPHRPSGLYQVLCCFERAQDGHAVYHVHTVGSRELRCVGEPPAPWASGDMVIAMPMLMYLNPPVLAGGMIYWQQVRLPAGGNGMGNNMLVYDTMAESFQHLLSPVRSATFVELFQMNSGALGLYNYCSGTADLWVLQDHGSWSWSMNHRIKLPELVYSLLPVLDPEGDVLVLSDKGKSGMWQHLQHISGSNGSLVSRYEWSFYLKLSRHRFKESLVHHDFFSMEGNASGVVERPLFDGLSTVAVLHDDNSQSH